MAIQTASSPGATRDRASALLCTMAGAQSLGDVRPSPEPLMLKQQGSFFVGGRQMFSNAAGWT